MSCKEYRRNVCRISKTQPIPEGVEFEDAAATNIFDLLDRGVLAEAIENAIAQLEPKYRLLMELRFLEEKRAPSSSLAPAGGQRPRALSAVRRAE
jgi:hypothetical protein